MPIPTVTELNEGKEDLDDLESLVNGTGNVQTRLGGIKPSYSQLTSALTHGDIEAYDPTETVTLATQWRSHSGIVYRPIPSALPISPTSPLETSPNTAKWLAVQLTFDKAQERYPNRQAFIDSTPDPLTTMVWIDSFHPYGSSASPYATPKSGHFMWRTGATNTAPTVSTSPLPSASSNGTGTQAGYAWDANGDEWDVLIIDNQIDAQALGATTSNLDTSLVNCNYFCTRTGAKLICNLRGELSDTVRMVTGRYEMDFTGSEFTSQKSDAGYAFEFASDDSGTLPEFNSVYKAKGFNLRAGASVGASTDGLSIGRQADQAQGESARVTFENLIVREESGAFRHCLTLLDEVFINAFINPWIAGGVTSCVRFLTQSNAGENINFHGGVIADAHDATDTGVGLLFEQDCGCDAYMNGTSVDYNDIQVKMLSGALHGMVHFENNSSQPDIILTETNNNPITFNLTGGTIATGPGGGVDPTPEPANGKTTRIQVTGSKINVSLTGVGNSLRDRIDTEVVQVVSGNPVIKIDAPFFDTSVDKPCILSRYLNRIYDGTFESAATTFWTLNGTSGATITNVNTQAYSGTRSLEFVGTVGGTFSALQTFNTSGQVRQLTQIRVLCTAYTSGSIRLVLRFFDKAGNVTGTRTATTTITATTGGSWTRIADTSAIPANISVMEVQLQANTFVGTAYIDDVVCNLI